MTPDENILTTQKQPEYYKVYFLEMKNKREMKQKYNSGYFSVSSIFWYSVMQQLFPTKRNSRFLLVSKNNQRFSRYCRLSPSMIVKSR